MTKATPTVLFWCTQEYCWRLNSFIRCLQESKQPESEHLFLAKYQTTHTFIAYVIQAKHWHAIKIMKAVRSSKRPLDLTESHQLKVKVMWTGYKWSASKFQKPALYISVSNTHHEAADKNICYQAMLCCTVLTLIWRSPFGSNAAQCMIDIPNEPLFSAQAKMLRMSLFLCQFICSHYVSCLGIRRPAQHLGRIRILIVIGEKSHCLCGKLVDLLVYIVSTWCWLYLHFSNTELISCANSGGIYQNEAGLTSRK